MMNKKGDTNIALILLGIVAIIAVVGLILLMTRPVDAYVEPRAYQQPLLHVGELNWNNLVAFASTNNAAQECAQLDTAQGGFRDLLNGEQPNCVAVPQHAVPQQWQFYWQTTAQGGAAVACFTSFAQSQPVVCRR